MLVSHRWLAAAGWDSRDTEQSVTVGSPIGEGWSEMSFV